MSRGWEAAPAVVVVIGLQLTLALVSRGPNDSCQGATFTVALTATGASTP